MATITLRAVLDSVQARAPLPQAARARVRAALGDRTTAGTLGNPFLAYQVENTPFPGGAPLRGMSTEHMTTATMPLASLYQRGARVRVADANVATADAERRAVSQRVALDAARAFFRVAVAQVSASAADSASIWLDSVATYNRARVQLGVAAEADLIRSELERDRTLADGAMLTADLARARAALLEFFADPAIGARGLHVALDDTPLLMPSERVDLPSPARAARPADARGVTVGSAFASNGASNTESAVGASSDPFIERRPDIQAGRQRLAAADAIASLERRMLMRDLGALLGVKQTAGTTSMVAGMSLPIPLFNQNAGGRTRAVAERDAVLADLVAQQRKAQSELVGAADAARILTQRAVLLTRRDASGTRSAFLARADEARAIALGAYREGAVSLLQVLDAARAWGDARVAYYRTLYAQHEAVLELVVARGDDLVTALPFLTPAASRGERP